MEQKSFMDTPVLRLGDVVSVAGRGGKIVAFGTDGRVQVEHIGDDGAYSRWYAADDVPGAKSAYIPQAVTAKPEIDPADAYQAEIDRLQKEIDALKLDIRNAESTADALGAKLEAAELKAQQAIEELEGTEALLEEAERIIEDLDDESLPVMEVKSWSDNPKFPNDAGLNTLLVAGWRIKHVQIVVDERDFWRFVMLERVRIVDDSQRTLPPAPSVQTPPPDDDDPETDDLPEESADDELIDLYGETIITFDEDEEQPEPVRVYAGPIEVLTRDHPEHITFEDALKSGKYTAAELMQIGDREALRKVEEKMAELRRDRKPINTPEWAKVWPNALTGEVQS